MFREKIGFISRFKQDRLNSAMPTERYAAIPVEKEEIRSLRNWFIDRKRIPAYQNALQRGRISRNLARELAYDFPWFANYLQFHHVRVTSLGQTSCASLCLEVPEGHRFVQNGFSFGNSQGDEWPIVMVLEQKCSRWDHKRWAYTSASRAKESVLWVEGY
jgi:hypothetical protein